MGIDVLSTTEGCSSRAGIINLSSQTCNSMIQRSLHVGCPIITRMLHYPNEVYVLHPPSRSFRIVLVSGACLIFIEGILCIMLIRYEKINNTWNSYGRTYFTHFECYFVCTEMSVWNILVKWKPEDVPTLWTKIAQWHHSTFIFFKSLVNSNRRIPYPCQRMQWLFTWKQLFDERLWYHVFSPKFPQIFVNPGSINLINMLKNLGGWHGVMEAV